MSFSKKIIILPLASIIIGAIAMPVVAQQQKSYCWQKKDCTSESIGGEWSEAKGDCLKWSESKSDCLKWSKSKGDCLEGYGYCTAKEKSLTLQVPIGGLKNTTGLNQYIPAVYNYLIAIVGIVAIVMIMVGGLQYLTAGSSGRVQEAKNRIIGAVIGLILALASYTILQTINPNLVKMQLPIKVKMVAPPWAAQKCPNTGIYVGEFQCGKNYTLKDKGKSGNPPPIKSGSCAGIHCEKGAKDIRACTHLTYDGAKSPECAHQNAVKACELMKQGANGCLKGTWDSLRAVAGTPGTSIPSAILGSLIDIDIPIPAIGLLYLKDQCLSSGTQLTIESNNNLKLTTVEDLFIGTKYNMTFKLTDTKGGSGPTFDFSDMYAKKGNKANTITFSLCEASVTGCQGPNKKKIDELCKFLAGLPSDSGFFADGAF